MSLAFFKKLILLLFAVFCLESFSSCVYSEGVHYAPMMNRHGQGMHHHRHHMPPPPPRYRNVIMYNNYNPYPFNSYRYYVPYYNNYYPYRSNNVWISTGASLRF